MIIILLLVFLLILLYIKTTKLHNYWIDRGVAQGKSTYLLGDTAGVLLKRESFCKVITRLYNLFPNERYMGIYQTLMMPVLIIRDIELIKQVGVKEFEHFIDHKQFVVPGDPFWNRNLFALTGSKWKDMRTTLSPSFTSNKMKIIFNLILECTENYIQHFLKADGPQTIELKDTFSRYTNDAIATVAFGIKCDSMKHKTNEFYLTGEKMITITFWKNLALLINATLPTLSKAFSIRFIPKSVSDFFENIIKDTIQIRGEQGIVRPDMLHLLLDARKEINTNEELPNEDEEFATTKEVLKANQSKKLHITDTDIAAQALVFFFAGFDTTSTLMCFMAYELALNPDIQNKLQQEVDNTAKVCDGKLTSEHLVKMKYMDMVVTETLRKWPPIINIDRVCTKSYTIQPTNSTEKMVVLQPGDIIWIPIYALHRDPNYYPNPDRFDPERFNDENKGTIEPYTFLPFGVGPRSCIGSRLALLKVKAVFFNILQKFDFVANEKTDAPLRFSKGFFTLDIETDISVNLIQRK